jgi:hypothetical protein
MLADAAHDRARVLQHLGREATLGRQALDGRLPACGAEVGLEQREEGQAPGL